MGEPSHDGIENVPIPHHPDDDVEKEISDLHSLLGPVHRCVKQSQSTLRVSRASLRSWSFCSVVYNVDPSEARANLEAWREALTKELGVVWKGFRRLTHDQFRSEGLEGNPNVTYLPSKVVYMIKPPDQGGENSGMWKFLQGRDR